MEFLSHDQCQSHICENQNTALQGESRVLSTIPVGSQEKPSEWEEPTVGLGAIKSGGSSSLD